MVDASPQRFGRGQELRLNCTAGGHPMPRTAWKRWGWMLEQGERYPVGILVPPSSLSRRGCAPFTGMYWLRERRLGLPIALEGGGHCNTLTPCT